MLYEADMRELLSKKQDELNKTKATLEGIREERDQLRRKVHNLLQELTWWQDKETQKPNKEETIQISSPVSRKAERVKLKKLKPPKSTADEVEVKPLIGKTLDPNKLSSPLVGHLVAPVLSSSTIQEILHSSGDADLKYGNQNLMANFELEISKVNSHNERLKAEKNLLRLTLQETKGKMEQFQLLLLKYESNDAAYEQALFYSELINEAYDAFVSLLEEKILCLESLQNLSTNKGKALSRLHSILSGLSCLITSEYCDQTLDVNLYLQNSPRNQKFGDELTPSALLSLPKLVRKVAERKSAVKKSILKIKPFATECSRSDPKTSDCDFHDYQYDLENAVLLLELSTVKEELHKLKCRYMSTYDDEFDQTTQWHSDVESEDQNDDDKGKHPAFLSLADLRISTMTESEIGTELSEALKREEKLKKENEKLGFMLQQVQHNSERRHRNSMEVLMRLKTLYGTLLENSRKEKIKHSERVEELHEQLASLSADQLRDMKSLKRQMKAFGRKKGNATHTVNETEL